MSAEIVTPGEQVPAEKAPPKRSAFELVKENSHQLRGTIALELAQDVDHLNDQNKNLLKFHGSYQQEDRDARKNRRKDGLGKYYMFMVRCRIPGGRLTADQYLAVDDLAGTHGNGTLRFTTRQGIQLHGILKANLKETIAGINQCLLTTLGACGDVERNVMCCPAPYNDGIRAQLQQTAADIAAHLAPRTRAYHEIWLNGQPVEQPRTTPHDYEPLYGKTYLPRKFKTGIALPDDNCIDLYAQDLGLLAIVEQGRVVGYNVLVGGGMGMTHGNANTFPFLAKPICYVPATAVVGAAEAVVKLFRDHGNRGDRKRARIKYLVHEWGVDKFRQVLADYLGGALTLPRPVGVTGADSHLGWHPQGGGQWFFGLSVENGRVKDEGSRRLRTALRLLLQELKPSLRITPNQDLLLCDLEADALPVIEKVLADHGVRRPDQLSTVRKLSMACPAIPTCGLAISESERALPGVIDQLEQELSRLGLGDEPITVRMTGCPNGCARPYQSDIGIVGRSGDKYLLYVGGRMLGDRLNFPLRDLVPLADIVPTLVPVLREYKNQRQPGEGFGDYCTRVGIEALRQLLPPLPEKGSRIGAEPGPDGPTANGGVHAPGPTAGAGRPATPALAAPQTEAVPVALPAPETRPVAAVAPGAKQCETFFVGGPGEERADYAYRYASDGSIRETVVFFYEDDARAASARPGSALRREAAYAGKVDPYRLHAARKLSDTYHVGPAGAERRDRRVDYHADGRPAATTLCYYEGDCRASEAAAGAALRRQVVLAPADR